MTDASRISSKDPDRVRLLSLDGGGIYGLTGAIWLRRLCEGNPRFLDGNDIDLFAGTSSGAINALMLASHARPRDAVLAGELERFWTGAGPFSNSRPLRAALSKLGVRGWFSDVDLLDALREWFGPLELGELPHRVHISTFNWTGVGRSNAVGGVTASRAGQAGARHWRPKFYGNIYRDDDDCYDSVAEIAYAAATPPMFRPMRGGLGDGASFNGNPSVSAIAQILRTFRVEDDGGMAIELSRGQSAAPSPDQVGEVLRRMSLLSVGSGQRLPYFAVGNIDLGLAFSTVPSNPFIGAIWPPSVYALDAATEEAEFITKQLLGHRRALRLNPATMSVPTIIVSLWARNPWLRDRIIDQIYRASETEWTHRAIRNTLEFIAAPDGWNRG